ncbi:structural maintenance of chromosomes protein 1B isoform X2 [Antennarius striatus]|uniref:structural maintenance of chromosomes protein 1B isoform X2 n=1 Tax=Antennarius striatus TaxID=241820 RepID=UPI0035B3C2B0
MGYLKQINIDNFKSWKGKHVIGPFLRFNCVIGTNGSGKSNIMDALSFAAGERAARLRVRHLRDLIHGAHMGRPVSDRASVALVYSDDRDRETVFCRSVIGDSSEYHINGLQIPGSRYLLELEKIGIVTKAQNCLVFQGAVESIALKDPKERTKMFECISQSREFSAEYDEKKKALLQAEEDTRFLFNKKKSAIAEKKQVAQDQIEAQNYQTLVEDLNQTRLQLSLAELYRNEQDIIILSSRLTGKQQAAAAKKGELVNGEQTVKTCRKEHGRLVREQQVKEKEVCAQENILSQSRSQYIKAKVNTSHHMKKAEEARDTLTRTQKLMADEEQELEEGRQEVCELEVLWRKYEKQTQEKGGSWRRDIQLGEDQLTLYKELKRLAHQQGAVLSQQADQLHWGVRADQEQLALDQRRKKEVEAAIKNSQSQMEDLSSRAEKIQEYIKKCNSALADHCQQQERLSADLDHSRRRGEEVKQELGQVLEALGNASLDTQESRRQLQRKELMYGRLSDLCSPVHKKYQLAVIKVFGRYMNSIVVATQKVARDCISFMKEERAEPETFLPIDFLDVVPLNERLRDVHGAKMVVDVIQVSTTMSAQLRKVVQFVCGNTLVCETIEEARRTAFKGQDRRKTVSLDGTLFAKSGVISGGSGDLRSKARCWDDKELTRLRERKDQLTTELRDLMRLRRKESDLKQVMSHIQGTNTRLKYSRADLETLQKSSIPQCQAGISRMMSELANLDVQIRLDRDALDLKHAEMRKIREQLEQMEDEVFSDFCTEIGVDSIREYEQEHLKQQTELDKKRLDFERQLTQLNTQLEYKQTRLEQQQKKLRVITETIDQKDKLMTDQRKDEERLLAALEDGQNKLLELRNQLLSKKSQVSTARDELDQRTQSVQEINRELEKLHRELMSAESSLEQKRLAKHNMLLACKIQGLPVTFLSGVLSDISEVQQDTQSESTSATADVYEREAQLVIDYSGLEAELGSLPSEEEVEAHVEKLKESLASMEAVLQRTSAPNLKALEKMREVKDNLQGVMEAFDTSSRATRKCSQEFERIKSSRLHRFSKCFDHVSVTIDQIYKRICRNNSAQAILTAEDPDEPYLSGINYNCVAPGKRYLSMDNLSGGEKAIAALALVFAVHSFCPAPFLILDEVDAALDNTNIGKVTTYIREESRENMQIIVISQKEEFFSKSEALLGVFSGFGDFMFSRVLTLDLRPYPLTEDSETEA